MSNNKMTGQQRFLLYLSAIIGDYDFVTISGKEVFILICTHFEEIDEYVKEKNIDLSDISQRPKLSEAVNYIIYTKPHDDKVEEFVKELTNDGTIKRTPNLEKFVSEHLDDLYKKEEEIKGRYNPMSLANKIKEMSPQKVLDYDEYNGSIGTFLQVVIDEYIKELPNNWTSYNWTYSNFMGLVENLKHHLQHFVIGELRYHDVFKRLYETGYLYYPDASETKKLAYTEVKIDVFYMKLFGKLTGYANDLVGLRSFLLKQFFPVDKYYEENEEELDSKQRFSLAIKKALTDYYYSKLIERGYYSFKRLFKSREELYDFIYNNISILEYVYLYSCCEDNNGYNFGVVESYTYTEKDCNRMNAVYEAICELKNDKKHNSVIFRLLRTVGVHVKHKQKYCSYKNIFLSVINTTVDNSDKTLFERANYYFSLLYPDYSFGYVEKVKLAKAMDRDYYVIINNLDELESFLVKNNCDLRNNVGLQALVREFITNKECEDKVQCFGHYQRKLTIES